MEGKIVLLIDDDTILRGVIKSALEELGHEIHDFSNPEDAFMTLRRIKVVNVLVADLIFPGFSLNGIDVARIAHRARPEIETLVVISGHPDFQGRDKSTDPKIEFLAKPQYVNADSVREFALGLLRIFGGGVK